MVGLSTYEEINYKIYGLRWDRKVIDRRIAESFQNQIANGFLRECGIIDTQSNFLVQHLKLSYKHLFKHIRGEYGFDAVETAIKDTKKFARKTKRWFRRDPRRLD